MRQSLALLFLFIGLSSSFSRPVANWPYDKLAAEADLIVIATPIEVRETDGKTTFPRIQQSGTDNIGHPVPVIAIETVFKTLAVLKGDGTLKNFVLHHLREANGQALTLDGPMPVRFDPKEKKRFLLFLKLEPDGRYAPLTGQTDPANEIKDLGTYP